MGPGPELTSRRQIRFYAALGFRLALRRKTKPLDALGLAGVESHDRVEGTSPGRSFAGRFDSPGFPVLYAAESPDTCAAEIAHHIKVHYLDRKHVRQAKEFHYTLVEIPIAGAFDDLRRRRDAPRGLQAATPAAYPAARLYARKAFQEGLDGLLYTSARHRGGTCVARFLAVGVTLATRAVGAVRFRWTGTKLVRMGEPS